MSIVRTICHFLSDKPNQDLPANAILIDVRSSLEFNTGRLQGAISIPLDQISMTIANLVPDKASPIIVYCQSGMRSASAKNTLLRLGYSNVINGGGLLALSKRMATSIISI